MRRALLVLAVLGSMGCRAPTQITLELSTDVPCAQIKATSIAIGSAADVEQKPAAAVTTQCQNGQLGALVIVPSGSKSDELSIKVTSGIDRAPEDCAGAGYKGCVVARRSLRFLPHTELTLPIALRSRCEGVACDPSSTCVQAACVKAVIPDPGQCTGAGCGEAALVAASPSGAGGGSGAGGLAGAGGQGGAGGGAGDGAGGAAGDGAGGGAGDGAGGASGNGGGGGCGAGQKICAGACVDPASDSLHCGGCAKACAPGERCQGGACVCPAVKASCAGQCVDLQSDKSNCGACGSACPAGESCVAGACSAACMGMLFCSGACVNEMIDTSNCGSCGNTCPTAQFCQDGACVCGGSTVLCGSACVNEMTDPSNCGSCGNTCPTAQFCQGGACVCGGSTVLCGSECVNEMTDPSNCGACGKACAPTASCVAGACSCPAGDIACGTACIDPLTDPANCGACGKPCLAHSICSQGQCSRLVFVTSTSFQGDFGVTGAGAFGAADAACAQAGAKIRLGTIWKAWLCTDSVTIGSRISTSANPLSTTTGTLVATDIPSFETSVHLSPIRFDESGAAVTGPVWTGTKADTLSAPTNCKNWQSKSSGDTGETGLTTSVDGHWTEDSAASCDTMAHFYCLEQ